MSNMLDRQAIKFVLLWVALSLVAVICRDIDFMIKCMLALISILMLIKTTYQNIKVIKKTQHWFVQN
jgi:hypothetical protein